MAATPGLVATTVSRCTANTQRGRHVFVVARHSEHMSLGTSKFIQSAAFTVGGHEWCIHYYPNGYPAEDCKDHASVFLNLLGKTTAVTQVRAIVGFRVIFPYPAPPQAPAPAPAQVTMAPVVPLPPAVSNRFLALFSAVHPSLGCRDFVHKSMLLRYVQSDQLVIECDVSVLMGQPVLEPGTRREIQVPPSDLSENLGKLLESGEAADVTFKVGEEIFHAHRVVLGTRSPVFKAQLYGLLGENNRDHITVEDMQPAIFKALLYFMYTDSLPAMDSLGGGDDEEIVKHLLVAADRYSVGRMKVMCESMLAKKLDAKNVAATLALADQYHCSNLKASCIDFINSLHSTEDMQASQGYQYMKRACPDIIVEMWEKATRSRKM